MDIYKTRECNKECARQNLQDDILIKACQEMEKGLVDADLGSGLYKKRNLLNDGSLIKVGGTNERHS